VTGLGRGRGQHDFLSGPALLTSDECDSAPSDRAPQYGACQPLRPHTRSCVGNQSLFSMAVRVSRVVVMNVAVANAAGVCMFVFVERDFECPVKAGRNTAQRSQAGQMLAIFKP
jgi:hypothetical protein